MKTALPAALLLLALGLATAAPSARAADAVRKARVATGTTVTLVDSAKTPAQWTAERPRVRDLRPRARGNFD